MWRGLVQARSASGLSQGSAQSRDCLSSALLPQEGTWLPAEEQSGGDLRG